MKKEESIKLLIEGKFKQWNKYREENPQYIPDLSNSHFSNLNLFNGFYSKKIEGTNIEMNLSDRPIFTGGNFENCTFKDSDLTNCAFDSACLKGVTFLNTKLDGGYFMNSDLRKSEFNNTSLVRAVFDNANLFQSRFEISIIGNTRFNSVNLEKSVFVKNNIFDTDIMDTSLKESLLLGGLFFNVDFSRSLFHNSKFTGLTLSNCNLSAVDGLREIMHILPSQIDLKTFLEFDHLVPSSMLEGFGIPQDLIDFVLNRRKKEYYSVFISYNHQDKDFAQFLYKELRARDISVWLDSKEMLPGADIYEQIDRGISNWDKILLCCSEHSLNSWWVDNEIDSVFEKERDLMKIRKNKIYSLIPLNLDNYIFTEEWGSGKKRQILSRIAADFTSPNKYQESIELLLKALKINYSSNLPIPKL